MSFEFTDDRIRKAVNTENGAVLAMNGTPEINYWNCVYTKGQEQYCLGLLIKRQNTSINIDNGPSYGAALCITAGNVVNAFSLSDIDGNQIKDILLDIAAMIGFICNKYPIASNSCVWSDFEDHAIKNPSLVDRLKGYLPISEELTRLSCPVR